jgi:hypothetical protein
MHGLLGIDINAHVDVTRTVSERLDFFDVVLCLLVRRMDERIVHFVIRYMEIQGLSPRASGMCFERAQRQAKVAGERRSSPCCILVCAHVFMALEHHFVDRSDSLESMLPSGRAGRSEKERQQ